MNYYHINKDTLTIISGPHKEQSTYIKKLTHCGNPELLDLSSFDLVPEIYETLTENQKYGDMIISIDSVTIPAIPRTQEELNGELEMRIQSMTDAAGYYINKFAHWTSGPMIYDKAKQGKVKSKVITDWTFAVWELFYFRLASLEAGQPWSEDYLDFSSIGPCPYPIKDAIGE